MRPALPLLVALCLAACTSPPPPRPVLPASAEAPVGTVTVAERFVTIELPGDELDSLATWPTEDGGVWLVASAKNVHQLVVFDADSGELLRRVGSQGDGAGEFLRPNGVFVHGDLLFVSERDNRRVQLLELPDFRPLGSFGQGLLRSPYGVWGYEAAPGELQVYVTDSFMLGPAFDVVPPLPELDRRVHRFVVRPDGDGLPRAQPAGTFGDTSELAALRIVESLAGDPVHDRLLVADEHRNHGTALREYTLAGRYTGGGIAPGVFAAEPEGLALWACTPDAGYWIVADQLLPRTVFRLFDRATLAPRGTFSGLVTAWTDGVALHASGTARFPSGVLFAVHHDRAVAAFDLRDIAQALELDPDCLQ